MNIPIKKHNSHKTKSKNKKVLSMDMISKPTISNNPPSSNQLGALDKITLKVMAIFYALFQPLYAAFRRVWHSKIAKSVNKKIVHISTPVISAVNSVLDKVSAGVLRILGKNKHTRKISYKYDQKDVRRISKHALRIATAVFVLTLIMPPINPRQLHAATGNVYPDGDITTGWANTTGSSYYTEIDEVTYSNTDYVNTGLSGTTGEVVEFNMGQTAGTTYTVTSVQLFFRAWANGGCKPSTGDCDTLDVDISLDGSYTGSANTYTLPESEPGSDQSYTWNGTWTGDDDLKIKFTRNRIGGGGPSGRDDDALLARAYAIVTYTIPTDVRQTHFRWRDDTTALDTDGGWLAVEDSNSIGDISKGTTYRLRIEAANVSSAVAANNWNYRLEYGTKGASCSAATGWTRIDTASDAFEMVGSTHMTDGESLDTSRLTASETTFVAGEGRDVTDESGATSLAVDEYTEMEYSIRATDSATDGGSYCFRLTDSGNTIDAYSVYPEVTISTPPPEPLLTQEGYTFENDEHVPNESGASWYNGSWSYRKKITVESTEVDADLTNFPVYVDLNDLGTDFHANVKSDGGDIRITESDGSTEVPREVVAIDTGTPDSGEVHFRATSLSSSVDTDFFIYYGNSGASDYATTATYGAQNVWSNGYVSVWHLDKDCANSSSGCVTDSVGNNNLTSYNFETGDNSVTGKLGNADNFDGTDAYHNITIDSSQAVGTTFSVTAWVNTDTAGSDGVFTSQYNTDLHLRIESDGDLHGFPYAANTASWDQYDVWSNDTGKRVTAAAGWQHASLTVDGTDARLLYNGAEVSTYDISGETPLSGTSVGANQDSIGGIGLYRDFDVPNTPSGLFDGQIDEVRFVDEPLTATWLSTEFTNQDTPNTFYTIGSQQTDTSSATTGGSSVQAGSKFTTGKTLSSVRQGERITLRTHLTNTGNSVVDTDELALFYDRNDGIWTKVGYQEPLVNTTGDCSNTDFNCTVVADHASDNIGEASTSLAFSPSGIPHISYQDATANDLYIAVYTGSGSETSCGTGSADWRCTPITVLGDVGDYSSLAFSPSGIPYVSYRTTADLSLAIYTGTGTETSCGSGGSANWDCDTIDNTTSTNVGNDTSIAFSPSGVPYISHYDFTDDSLRVATYTGTGTETSCGAGGSADWDCVTVDDHASDNLGAYTSIAFSSSGTPYISYYGAFNLKVAIYTGTGTETSCGTGSSDWDCVTVDDHATHLLGKYTSIAFSPSGVPYVAYYNDTGTALKVAFYTGTDTETSCGNGSADWDCILVEDANIAGFYNSMGFLPSGAPYVVNNTAAVGGGLSMAVYTGTGAETSCGGGSADWDCFLVDTGDTDIVGRHISAALSPAGTLYISYYNQTTDSLNVASAARTGEILIASSVNADAGDSLAFSHADMTSSTDTTNQDDSDCISAGATWNNGTYMESENGTGLVIPAGHNTEQCTELAWTIDTSQATPGETYRFAVATKDAFRSDKGPWRGPISVATDAYPTLTIADADESVYRYSKDTLGGFGSDCTDTDWTCGIVYDGQDDTDGSYNSIAFDSSGTAWVSFSDNNGTADDLTVAHYVGGGLGTGCGTSGSTDWTCEVVYDGQDDTDGTYTALAISPTTGTPWVAFHNDEGTADELIVANYVGSGGNCDTIEGTGGSDAWQCTVVYQGAEGLEGATPGIAIDQNGIPWVVSFNEEGTLDELVLSHYVGSGGNCDGYDAAGGSDAWQCEAIYQGAESADAQWLSIAISDKGSKWISFKNDETSGDDLVVAQFVGSGGNCDGFDSSGGSDAWQCTTVFDGATDADGTYNTISLDSNGDPWVSFHNNDASGDELFVAEYVGGTGGNCNTFDTGTLASTAWNCMKVFDGADNLDGATSMLTFDSEGLPWVSFHDNESGGDQLIVASYVGSGGDCDDTAQFDGGSDAWDCTLVDTGIIGADYQWTSTAFDHSGTLWVSVKKDNGSADDLSVAKLKLPKSPPSRTIINQFDGKNAGNGQLQYSLASGLAPYTDPYGDCGGVASMLGYCGLYTADGHLDSMTAQVNEKPVYSFSTRYATNTEVPTASAYFRSDTSPATNNVVLQAYRYGTTNAWETVSTYSTAGCSTENCVINAHPSGTTSEYYETDGSEYWVHYRLYQVESTSASITLSLDQFTAHKSVSKLRNGRVFRENVSDPLRW